MPARTRERRTASKPRSPSALTTPPFPAARARRKSPPIGPAPSQCPSLRHLHEAIEKTVEQQREDHDDDRPDHGGGRAAAEIEELEGLDVGVETEQLGGARRPAAGNCPYDVERAERVDRADHDAHHDDRTEHR